MKRRAYDTTEGAELLETFEPISIEQILPFEYRHPLPLRLHTEVESTAGSTTTEPEHVENYRKFEQLYRNLRPSGGWDYLARSGSRLGLLTGSDRPASLVFDTCIDADIVFSVPIYQAKRDEGSGALAYASAQLNEVSEEAIEEGFQPPPTETLSSARQLLIRLCHVLDVKLDVYPTPDREVAFTHRADPQNHVTVIIEPDGGAVCFATIAGRKRRCRYETSDDLPDMFLLDALQRISNRRK